MVSALQKGKRNHQGIVLKAGEGGLMNKALASSFLRGHCFISMFFLILLPAMRFLVIHRGKILIKMKG